MTHTILISSFTPFVRKFTLVWLLTALFMVALGNLFPIRLPYLKSDLIAYKIATDLAVNGGNPYDPDTIKAEWTTRTGGTQKDPLMVWNPPILFLFPGTILRLPETVLYRLWPLIPYFSGAILTLIGFRLAGGANVSILSLVISILISIPLLIEFQISQLSSLLSLGPLLGVLLFLQRRDLLAGGLLSLAFLKPHIVFFPLAAIAFWTIRELRWKVVAGGALGILLGSITIELLLPGITLKWINRSNWPTDVLGSVIPQMLRSAAIGLGYQDPIFLTVLIPFLGVLGLWLYLACKAPCPTIEPIIWTLALNQIFTPYGFIFDQATLLVVQAFVISKISDQVTRNRFLLAIFFANMTAPIILTTTPEPLQRLWWVSYPITLIPILTAFMPAKAHPWTHNQQISTLPPPS